MSEARTIYHLSPLSELRSGCSGESYLPARFSEDGFVHCTTQPETVLMVAGDYFSDLGEPLAVLALEVAKLSARVAFEAPAPIEGGGAAHLDSGERFPHVYGPIDLVAVGGAALLEGSGESFEWPSDFTPLADFWSAHPPAP